MDKDFKDFHTRVYRVDRVYRADRVYRVDTGVLGL